MRRRLLTLTAAVALLLTSALSGAVASAHADPVRQHATTITVTGAVTTPGTYTLAQLAALPQVTLPDLRGPDKTKSLTGASLQALVAASSPTLPDVKNAQLRVTITVVGRDHHRVAFALGELDANGGNHPALLSPVHGRHNGPAVDLVVPGDQGYRRTVRAVSRIQVAVAAPQLPTNLPAGSIQIKAGQRVRTLTAAQLSRLRTHTRTVAYLSGQGPQTHVETGPNLAAVLRLAKIRTTPATTVAAIADDGYVATVTPAEAPSGRRTLLLSTVEDGIKLDQPRLVTDGDVFGGRYVTGVLGLEVTSAARCR